MRDIVLTVFVFGMIPMMLRHPYIGALMYAWISMMNPHRLAFGFAHNFQFAAIIAGVTLLSAALSRKRLPFPWTPVSALLVLFMVWMTITSVFAMGPYSDVFETWLHVFKIHIMLLLTLMLVRGQEHMRQLIWVIVLSIGFFGVKGGIWTVATGGGERVYGPPGGVIENNNELALALVMIIPLMYYLMSTAKMKLVRYGLIVAMIFCSFSVLGSHSRGAFLAIVAAAAMLSLKSRHPVLLGVLGGAGLLAMFAFMPTHWWSRMHTMEGSPETLDWSAVSRLHTWQTLWNMALDHPIVGAGFETTLPEIFRQYAPVQGMLAYSPHSIYFQVLGEHGFTGLFIYLALIVVTWRSASRLARVCLQTPGFEWGSGLMRMIQVSLIGFLVGGAFLNLLHFDMPYYLMGLVVMLDATLKDHIRDNPPQKSAAGGPARVTQPPSPPRPAVDLRPRAAPPSRASTGRSR
jgi:putative inorganic carbon (HCO3(-)) transporter